MGFFDRLTGKNEEREDDLSVYSGMRMEVATRDGKFLFAARSNVDRFNTLQLQPISVPPKRVNGLRAVLRGYVESSRKAVHMEGTLFPQGNGMVEVEDVDIMGEDNDRAFFRQDTAMDGEIMPMKQSGIGRIPCKILNVSAGGVCIFAGPEYRVGDRLLLNSDALKKWNITPLVCAICRVTKRKGGCEYGCEFLDLTAAKEDMIAAAIMEMQRQRMRRE